MSIMDEIKVDRQRNRIYLQCSRETLFEMSHILNSLIDLTRIVRNRQALVHHEEERRAAPVRVKQKTAAQRKAAGVHALYQRHLGNGSGGNRHLAIRSTAAELGLLNVDVRVLLQLHREAQKKEATC